MLKLGTFTHLTSPAIKQFIFEKKLSERYEGCEEIVFNLSDVSIMFLIIKQKCIKHFWLCYVCTCTNKKVKKMRNENQEILLSNFIGFLQSGDIFMQL